MKAFEEWNNKNNRTQKFGCGAHRHYDNGPCPQCTAEREEGWKEALKWVLANYRTTIWNEHDLDFVRGELEDKE